MSVNLKKQPKLKSHGLFTDYTILLENQEFRHNPSLGLPVFVVSRPIKLVFKRKVTSAVATLSGEPKKLREAL